MKIRSLDRKSERILEHVPVLYCTSQTSPFHRSSRSLPPLTGTYLIVFLGSSVLSLEKGRRPLCTDDRTSRQDGQAGCGAELHSEVVLSLDDLVTK